MLILYLQSGAQLDYFGKKLIKSKKRTLGTKKLIKMKYDKMNYIEANPLDLL